MNNKTRKSYYIRETCSSCAYCIVDKHPHYSNHYLICLNGATKQPDRLCKNNSLVSIKWMNWAEKNNVSPGGVCNEWVGQDEQ